MSGSRGILAMIGSAACWGFATVMSRDLLHQVTPRALLVIQLGASVTVLVLLSLRKLVQQGLNARFARASLTGVLEPGLAYTVGLAGLDITTAGNASVIAATEPIFIVLLGWLLLGERPSGRLAACITVAFVGLIMISWSDLETLGGGRLKGDGLIVVSTLFAAAYVVASAPLARDYAAAPLAAAQQSVGFILALAVYAGTSALGLERGSICALDAGVLAYAAVSGVVQYAAAFWLYLIGLARLPPGIAGLWLTLSPVFGLAGGMIWLGERPAWPVYLGAALIIGAVAAVLRAGTPAEAPA